VNARRTGIVLGVLSAIGVLLLAAAGIDRKSPGPVSRVHARIADLAGGDACASCHGGWFGDLRSACSECHDDIAGQLRERRGLHGTLAPELGGDCGECHGEHHGGEFRLVNRLAWAQAGVADPQRFDHARIGFPLVGAHTGLPCAKCHVHADAPQLPEGAQRFLGLRQDCASCHADPHQGAMQLDCTACHGQEQFTEPQVPEHDRWLRLDGAHAPVACRECHAPDTSAALERLTDGASAHARSCGDCHAVPHSPTFVAGNAAAAGLSSAASCAHCHPLDYPQWSDPRVSLDPAQHAHGGFPLAAPHDRTACAACHEPGQVYAARHPARRADDCAACHRDPHEGQFAAQSCTACHAATHFAPHEFGRDDHARLRLPLDGAHADAKCAACHEDPAAGAARRFTGTAHRCEACHADVHAPVFAAGEGELASNPRGRCAECHGTRAFAEVDHAAFAHGQRTGFPVDGAHAQIDCEDCHRRAPQPDAQGRRFGRIVAAGEPFGGCVACHGDPHRGAFEAPTVPQHVDGRTGCERCHDSASFRALPHGFDHGVFTGYPLVGAHAQVDCAACHARRPAADATGRTWEPAAGRECVDCHRDPHQGQFERLGRTDCARCHRSTTSFATLSFRHNLDSRFPLGDAHAQVPCAGCHKEERIGGVPTVRWKPLPTECAKCHGTGGAPAPRRRS
jgi:hypothetical protein